MDNKESAKNYARKKRQIIKFSVKCYTSIDKILSVGGDVDMEKIKNLLDETKKEIERIKNTN